MLPEQQQPQQPEQPQPEEQGLSEDEFAEMDSILGGSATPTAPAGVPPSNVGESVELTEKDIEEMRGIVMKPLYRADGTVIRPQKNTINPDVPNWAGGNVPNLGGMAWNARGDIGEAWGDFISLFDKDTQKLLWQAANEMSNMMSTDTLAGLGSKAGALQQLQPLQPPGGTEITPEQREKKFPILSAMWHGYGETTPFGERGWQGYVDYVEKHPVQALADAATWLIPAAKSGKGAGLLGKVKGGAKGLKGLEYAAAISNPLDAALTYMPPAYRKFGGYVPRFHGRTYIRDLDKNIDGLIDSVEDMWKKSDAEPKPKRPVTLTPETMLPSGVQAFPRNQPELPNAGGQTGTGQPQLPGAPEAQTFNAPTGGRAMTVNQVLQSNQTPEQVDALLAYINKTGELPPENLRANMVRTADGSVRPKSNVPIFDTKRLKKLGLTKEQGELLSAYYALNPEPLTSVQTQLLRQGVDAQQKVTQRPPTAGVGQTDITGQTGERYVGRSPEDGTPPKVEEQFANERVPRTGSREDNLFASRPNEQQGIDDVLYELGEDSRSLPDLDPKQIATNIEVGERLVKQYQLVWASALAQQRLIQGLIRVKRAPDSFKVPKGKDPRKTLAPGMKLPGDDGKSFDYHFEGMTQQQVTDLADIYEMVDLQNMLSDNIKFGSEMHGLTVKNILSQHTSPGKRQAVVSELIKQPGVEPDVLVALLNGDQSYLGMDKPSLDWIKTNVNPPGDHIKAAFIVDMLQQSGLRGPGGRRGTLLMDKAKSKFDPEKLHEILSSFSDEHIQAVFGNDTNAFRTVMDKLKEFDGPVEYKRLRKKINIPTWVGVAGGSVGGYARKSAVEGVIFSIIGAVLSQEVSHALQNTSAGKAWFKFGTPKGASKIEAGAKRLTKYGQPGQFSRMLGQQARRSEEIQERRSAYPR